MSKFSVETEKVIQLFSCSFLVASSNYSAAEAEQILRQILAPTKTLDKKSSNLDEVQRDKQTSSAAQRKFPGAPVREPWCPVFVSVVGLLLLFTSCSSWVSLALEPSCFWHIELSHSPLWKETHNSFIYSTTSAASAAKLPFPFCRIPVASFTSYSLSPWNPSYLFLLLVQFSFLLLSFLLLWLL